MLKKIFPNKQLLIRQNGEVKYFSLPTWLQFSLFLLLALVCAIAIFSSYQSVKLKEINTNQTNVIEQLHVDFDALHMSYREKHTELSDRISRFDEKSQLMTDMLSSLPEAQQIEFNNKTSQSSDETTTTNTSKPPSDSNEQQKDNQSKQPEQSELNTNTSVSATKHGAVANQNTLLALRSNKEIILVETQLGTRFKVLDSIVDKRTASLLNAIESSGMDKSYITDITEQSLAQGGPLYTVETDDLSDEQKALLDKVTMLNTLIGNVEQLPKTLPAKHFYISSVYGLRNDPISNRRAMHRGIDMAGWHKTKIFSPASGVVTRAGRNGGFGNFIEITHINGFVTRYGHLAKINVKRGQQVQKDQVIGLMGSSGRSTSTHLHYEILHNKRHINPLKFIKAFDNVSE